MKKSKSKKSFPDMSGDGKVTKKDILMARGVIKKTKKICEIICKVFKITPCVCDHECNCKKEK
jgi:hypothetical protein